MSTAPEDSIHRAECVRLGHPGMTYNPIADKTWCGCGERAIPGNTDQGVRCCRTVVEMQNGVATHLWRGACRS